MARSNSRKGVLVDIVAVIRGGLGVARVARRIPLQSPGRVSWVVDFLGDPGNAYSTHRTRGRALARARLLCAGGVA